MVFWGVMAGALLGWLAADFSEFGFLFGGLIGWGMGFWLRSAVRMEIGDAVQKALARHDPEPRMAEPFRAEPAAALAAPPPPARRSAPVPPPAPPPPPRDTIIPPPPPLEPAARYEPPEPGPLGQLVGKARAWLLGGNTIVRVGLIILFVGLVFLARLAVNAGLFPIQARLTLVALAGIALLVIGLRKRIERPPFALSLQGTGVAVLYLTVFAAAEVYEIMPPLAAFGFMILFAALGCALALMQNSLTMAMASFLGGFAVPVLLGGKSETPLGLFAYMTVLNLAILFIAWKKSWRPLNLLGFAATFLLAGVWGFSAFEDRHYLVCQIFLAVTVAIYLAMAVLYAHNTPGRLGNYADSTLLFGTALAGFGLQAGLVQDRPFAAAWSALGFGAAYLGVTAFTMRKKRPEMRLLNECMLAIGVGFVTLAVPLALDVRWASAAWALEGAGAFWVGARQARWMPRAFGLVLQAFAALIVLGLAMQPNVSGTPLLNIGFIAPLLVALPMLFTAWLLRNPLEHSGSSWAKAYVPAERRLGQIWFLGGFVFACLALFQEVTRFLPAISTNSFPQPVLALHVQVLGSMLAVLALMALADWFGRRKDWSVATWPGHLSLPLIALCFLSALIQGRHVLFLPDVAFWIAAIALHLWLLRRQTAFGLTEAMHTGGVLLLTGMLADSLALGVERGALWDTSWAGVVFLVSAIAVLMGLTRWAGRAAPLASTQGLGWPRDPHAWAYWWHAGIVLAFLVYVGALTSTLIAEGVTAPLPYVPLLNPVDLSALLALAALALWRRMVGTADPRPAWAEGLLGGAGLALGALLAFAIVNTMWLRTAHHFLGLDWDAETLAASEVVQTGYSILWTLIAMGLMLWARRRGERLPWLAGAVLLGVVVAKLLFIDMSKAEGLARIIAFIGVGVIMLLIGYFVPLPPRKDEAEEAKP